MRNSFALVILAALLSLSGCESVSQVPVNLEPKSVSETAMLKLYEMTADRNCDFVLWNGNKRMIKREQFEAYLKKSYSI